MAVCIPAKPPAPYAQPGHEGRQDNAYGIGAVAEDQNKLSGPQDFIDKSGCSGKEKKRIDH